MFYILYIDTYEEARKVENNTLDISTNDEETLAEITQKKDSEISQKRVIQKPPRFFSSSSSNSSSEQEEKETKTKKRSITHSMNQKKIKNLDETAESSCMY